MPPVGNVTPNGWGIYTSNGFFSGTVAARQGKIGNGTAIWTIGSDGNSRSYIYSGISNITNSGTTKGIYVGTNGISNYENSTQYVNLTGGKITAQGADIQGTVPFTADINAHEHMGAYAVIAILEAVLKLGIAAAVWYSSSDKLVVYAWLLVAAALLSRGAYAAYALSRFPESRAPWRADGSLVKEMGAFAGWNFLGSGAYMLNTQGINQLMNLFFGVGMNAARGVADKVEQVVRQFATNIALALNPALTKAYVSGNREYAFELVCKGSKYYFWILWVLALPFFTDADTILSLWLGSVPPEAAFFTKLTLLCFVIDFTPGTLNVLVQAGGRIRRYYIWTSLVASLAFPITYVAYRLGAPAWVGYAAFAFIYIVKAVVMMRVAHKETGLPLGDYWKKGLWPALAPGLMTLIVISFIPEVLPAAWWRFLVTAALGAVSMATAIWQVGLTEGEKAFVKSKLKR